MSDFGATLKSIRKNKQLTMRELSSKTGISHSYISQLESGKRAIPRPDTIRKLAKGLGESQTLLMEEAGYLAKGEQERREKVAEAFSQHNEKVKRIFEEEGGEINPEGFPQPFTQKKIVNVPQMYKVDNEQRYFKNSDLLDIFYYINLGKNSSLFELTYKGKPIKKEKLDKLLKLYELLLEED